ncbi:MAG: hypothetical protein JW881_18120 [Spirochaetales bacterium]|nr:hypothetical protein [Spirochaetales bacterium]
MKKNAIVTASDRKYGDVLIENWFASIQDNIDLTDIDVCVIDYGMSKAQRFYLKEHNVLLFIAPNDGHVVILRYRDLKAILLTYNFDQVLLCDSGDIIFQTDISHLFLENGDSFRAVYEDIKSPFSLFITDEFFRKDMKKEIERSFIENRMINAGFVLGPRMKMLQLCQRIEESIKNKRKFGPDQLVVNYVLHKEGFVPLPTIYNFVINTSLTDIYISDGVFHTMDGTVIPVVHNSGHFDFIRPVENFGYGKDHNILKKDMYGALKKLLKSSDNLYKTHNDFLTIRKKISASLARMAKKIKKRYRQSKKIISEELDKLNIE